MEILLANAAILVVSYVLEKTWHKNYRENRVVTYEKIELIGPDKRDELMQDLRQRTGLNITEIDIVNINFLRDTARIRIFYE